MRRTAWHGRTWQDAGWHDYAQWSLTRDQALQTWVGTNDTGATDTDPDGSGSPNNMLQVSASEYDGGAAGQDGNLTETTAYVDASGTKDRVTSYQYDFRNRQTVVIGEVDLYLVRTYDNLDRVTQVDRRNTSRVGI